MENKGINPSLKQIAVARVNGTVISEYQVTSGLESVLDPYKDTKGKVRLSQPEQYAARKQIIDNLVMRELLLQEGTQRGIAASEEEISQAVATSSAEYQSQEHFEYLLQLQGLTFEELKEQLRRDIIVNKLAAACVEDKRQDINDADARTYYNEHKADMVGPEARRILHIEIPLDRYAEKTEEDAVHERLEHLDTPAAIEELVAGDGCAERAINAEDLGFIKRGDFHPLLDSIAFRLQEDEVSRIVRTDEGLHRLLVKTVLPSGKTWPFEMIVEELKKKIYELNSVNMVNDLAAELRSKASVQILDTVADSKLEQEFS
ncbi:MAG: hypothetical protein GY868_04165 [Deltaproteobacteria bacterium]|nr:hypothetical protein [Deltaproteobacteria bacterium]